MKSTTVSIAEGKKGFSRLIENARNSKEEIVITKRGKPVAVIVPYGRYQHTKRSEGYRKIMEARQALAKTRLTAASVHRESRKQLEAKS